MFSTGSSSISTKRRLIYAQLKCNYTLVSSDVSLTSEVSLNQTVPLWRRPHLRVGVQLKQRRPEAAAAAPRLCVGVEVIVRRSVQSLKAGEDISSRGWNTAEVVDVVGH